VANPLGRPTFGILVPTPTFPRTQLILPTIPLFTTVFTRKRTGFLKMPSSLFQTSRIPFTAPCTLLRTRVPKEEKAPRTLLEILSHLDLIQFIPVCQVLRKPVTKEVHLSRIPLTILATPSRKELNLEVAQFFQLSREIGRAHV